MAETKSVKIKANCEVKDPDSDTQMAWGVPFDVVVQKGKEPVLIAELPKDEAEAMIEANRAEKVGK